MVSLAVSGLSVSVLPGWIAVVHEVGGMRSHVQYEKMYEMEKYFPLCLKLHVSVFPCKLIRN